MHVVPLRLVFAVAVEHLDAVVLAVGDIDPAIRVAAHIVGDVELAGIGAGLAPCHQQLAVGRIFVDARIAVAVGDVDLALRRQCRVGAAVERLAAHIGRGLAGDAEGQQHPALEGAFAHRVVAVIGQKHGVVRGHVDAVRPVKDALAPGAQEVAVAVEHHHRVRAAAEGIDVVVPVDPDRGDVGIPFPAIGQLGPIVDDLVAVAVRPQNDRHGVLLHSQGLR